MPGVPTLPPGPGQQSEPGAAPLGERSSVSSFQPRHPGSGVRDQPLPPCSILCSWLAAVVVHSLPGGKRGQAPATLSFCCSSRCQGYSQKEKAPRLPQGTWVESGGSHPLQRQGFGRRMLGGDEGQEGTQQCHIPSPGPASAQVGGPCSGGRECRHPHAVRLWADLEAPWALWMMAVHFSRRSSLLFSKNPSLRGTPCEPSGKVRRPGEGREGPGVKGQGAAPTGDGAREGGMKREVLSRGRAALTKAVHTPAFELALKGHVVTAGEDPDAIELALYKLPLVPVWEDLLRQQLPSARGNARGGVCGSAVPTWSRRRR